MFALFYLSQEIMQELSRHVYDLHDSKIRTQLPVRSHCTVIHTQVYKIYRYHLYTSVLYISPRAKTYSRPRDFHLQIVFSAAMCNIQLLFAKS